MLQNKKIKKSKTQKLKNTKTQKLKNSIQTGGLYVDAFKKDLIPDHLQNPSLDIQVSVFRPEVYLIRQNF